MATQLAERRENPLTVIRQNLTAMAPEFRAALPAHVSVEKFTRVAQTAIASTPDLLNVDRRSLFAAVVRLAQDGLLPDGREAAIVKFGDKAQAMPMIAGILKKVRQSGEVSKISAHTVCENDRFVWRLGFDETVEHEPPSLDKPRGKVIGAYALAVLKDGAQVLEVMSLEEIERVRNVSRAKNAGPWKDWYGEMARKTVMRRLAKRLPMSTDLDDQFERDQTLARADDGPALEAVREEPAAPVSRLDALEHQIGTPTDGEPRHDDTPAAYEPNDRRPDDDNGGDHAPEGEDASPKERKFQELLAGLRNAKTLAEIKALDAEWAKHAAVYEDDVRADMEIEFRDARRRVRPA